MLHESSNKSKFVLLFHRHPLKGKHRIARFFMVAAFSFSADSFLISVKCNEKIMHPQKGMLNIIIITRLDCIKNKQRRVDGKSLYEMASRRLC